MRNISILLLLLLSLSVAAQKRISDYVDPFIGTGGHGHTFPGATLPFGMVQLSPDTRIDGSWDGCSGYHFSDSIIYGFSHTHLSGTGCSDYGDILLMPSNNATLEPKKYASKYSHKNETAKAGYYSVVLNNNIKAELTSGLRVGAHRYTFPKQNTSFLILDLLHRDKTLRSEVNVIDNRHLSGMRRSEAWAKDQHVYFYMEFSAPFTIQEARQFFMKKDPTFKGAESGVVLRFNTSENNVIEVRCGISMVSEEGAKKNLEAELNKQSFEEIRESAALMWDKALSKISVEGDEEKKSIFYTAFYHTMIHPNIANDADGSYRGRDNKIHAAEKHNYYTVFSLWDTFRALHPLLSITETTKTQDFVKTFLLQYQQGGRLPVWELSSNETDCMIGYHSVSVINDAISKGLRDFDLKLAYDAMQHSATLSHLGLASVDKKNLIEATDEHESVSKTLEYAYDDWCIAQTAKLLSREDDYQYFMRRSQSWKNLFDPETKLMRPRTNGGWLSPFDPKEVNNHFTEGNSWQYSFFVPHDLESFVTIHGGDQQLEKKLDQLFSETNKTTGREQADITGLIGQYAHGNEPSHHIAYLYNTVGSTYKTQETTTRILNELYKTGPEGLCGNEDCGQMSAWYVLSSLGIYQVCPGKPFYEVTMPLFDKSTIRLENGKEFVIEIVNPELRSNPKARIGRVDVNGLTISWTKLAYDKIMNGGKMEIVLTTDQVQYWGNFFQEAPPQIVRDYAEYNSIPSIAAVSQTFRDSLQIKLLPPANENFVQYIIKKANDTSAISDKDMPVLYKTPVTISSSSRIIAISGTEIKKSLQSMSPITSFSEGYFYKMPNNYSVEIKGKFNSQYSAGGNDGIIDGLRGDVNWRKGKWQGFQGQDAEFIIDMKANKKVQHVSIGFLQDTRSWILMPKSVEVSFSKDGKKFSKPVKGKVDVKDNDYNTQTKELTLSAPAPVESRYVKIKISKYGKLPHWHQGAGEEAFFFLDEISIR